MLKNKIILASLIASVFIPLAVFAKASGDYGLGTAANTAGITQTPLTSMAASIVGSALSLVGVIFFALLIYGGFRWMLAMGKEEDTKKGLKAITAAIIGLLIILSAYAITNFVLTSTKGTPTRSTTGSTDISACTGKGSNYSCMSANLCDRSRADLDYSLCGTDSNKVCCIGKQKYTCTTDADCSTMYKCVKGGCEYNNTQDLPT